MGHADGSTRAESVHGWNRGERVRGGAGSQFRCAAPRLRLDAEPLVEALLRCERCAWEGRFAQLARKGSACPVCGSTKHVDRVKTSSRRSGT